MRRDLHGTLLRSVPLRRDLPAPQVWALLLEKTHPRLASDVIYVAGDRVVRAALQLDVQTT